MAHANRVSSSYGGSGPSEDAAAAMFARQENAQGKKKGKKEESVRGERESRTRQGAKVTCAKGAQVKGERWPVQENSTPSAPQPEKKGAVFLERAPEWLGNDVEVLFRLKSEVQKNFFEQDCTKKVLESEPQLSQLTSRVLTIMADSLEPAKRLLDQFASDPRFKRTMECLQRDLEGSDDSLEPPRKKMADGAVAKTSSHDKTSSVSAPLVAFPAVVSVADAPAAAASPAVAAKTSQAIPTRGRPPKAGFPHVPARKRRALMKPTAGPKGAPATSTAPAAAAAGKRVCFAKYMYVYLVTVLLQGKET